MDCLDRTNVVQAYLAGDALAKILSSWGILSTDSVAELEQNEAFLHMYRNSWADHANLISVQYAGTGALKTDYTRTGVRTHWGLLQDGWNSSIRYVKNNFRDGQRTDSIKFLLGELSTNDVIAGETARRDSLMQEDQNKVLYLPYVLLTLVALFVFVLLVSPRLSFNMIILCFILTAGIYGTFKFLLLYSGEFVNFPTSYVLNRLQRKA